MPIKELRTKYNLTQKAFSEITGIPKRTLENWEEGSRKPPVYLIPILEVYLAVKLKN